MQSNIDGAMINDGGWNAGLRAAALGEGAAENPLKAELERGGDFPRRKNL